MAIRGMISFSTKAVGCFFVILPGLFLWGIPLIWDIRGGHRSHLLTRSRLLRLFLNCFLLSSVIIFNISVFLSVFVLPLRGYSVPLWFTILQKNVSSLYLAVWFLSLPPCFLSAVFIILRWRLIGCCLPGCPCIFMGEVLRIKTFFHSSGVFYYVLRKGSIPIFL